MHGGRGEGPACSGIVRLASASASRIAESGRGRLCKDALGGLDSARRTLAPAFGLSGKAASVRTGESGRALRPLG